MKRNGQTNWMQTIYYAGTLASLVFIMAQAYYAGSSVIKSNEWEKAKMTIENIERFKENLTISSLHKDDLWRHGDGVWPDISTEKGWEATDTLRSIHRSLFGNEMEVQKELVQMIDVLDAFAYPIIMGYASEVGSYQSAARQYYTYGNFILPEAFHYYSLIGMHAKLLYKLWRIRFEMVGVDYAIKAFEQENSEELSEELKKQIDRLYCYEETDFSEASLKKYRKKLDKKLKETQKEIEVFRKNSLK